MISEKEKWVFKVNIIGTIILIFLIFISEVWMCTNDVSPYLAKKNKKEEHSKQRIEEDKDFKSDFTDVLSTLYAISQLARFIILFICTIDRKAYRLLLPVT